MTNAVIEPRATLPPVSRFLGAVAFAGGLLGLLLLAALHILRPDLDPSRHFISEYAVGAHGWVMALCFLSLGVGCASIVVALITQIPSISGRVGLGFLFAATVGLVMAAAFPMDPLSVAPENASFSGQMHGVAATIGNPGFIIGATLISLALRKNPVWAPVLTPLFATAVLIWISLMLMIAFLFALAPGMSGPSAVGWANRLLVIAYGAWLMIAARPVLRIGQR